MIVTAGLLVRYWAQDWGFILGTGARAALITSLGVHVVTAVGSVLLLRWTRRRLAMHPLAPKVALSLMPIFLLVSVDGLLNTVIRRPAIHPYMPHAVRDWTFRPDSGGVFLGKSMRINSHGLPGPEVEYGKDDDEYRVLFLGDSVAAGFGVLEEECFAWRLPRLLHASGAQGVVTTVNCSCMSYSPWQQVDLLETEGMRYDPEVIVHVFCLNDYVEKFCLARFGGDSSGPYEFVSPTLRRSGLYRALRLLLAERGSVEKKSRRELLARYSIARLIREPDAPQFRDAWRITFENMDKIVKVARRNNRPFAIVCFPYAIQIAPGAVQQPAPQARLADFARARDVPFLDLLPAFRTHVREHNLTADDLFLDHSHPTAVGHAIAADEIHAFLVEHDLLPRESHP